MMCVLDGIWLNYDLGPLKPQFLLVKNKRWDGFWWCKDSGQCKSAPQKTWKSSRWVTKLSGKTKEEHKNKGMLMLPLGSMGCVEKIYTYMEYPTIRTSSKSRASGDVWRFKHWSSQGIRRVFGVFSFAHESRLSDAYLESSWWVDGGLVLGLGSYPGRMLSREKLFDFNSSRRSPKWLLKP